MSHGKVQVRERRRAVLQAFIGFESAAHEAADSGKQQRRKRGGGYDRARHFEVQAVGTQEKQAHERGVHGVVPDERCQDAPAHHHDSRDDANQPDLDAADISRLLRIIAVQKAPEKGRKNHGEPAGLCKFREKRNGKKAEGEFFVRRSQQADRRAREPREERVHGLFVVHFLRGPRSQPVRQDIECHDIADVHGGERQAHNRRRKKLLGAQSAQSKDFGKAQALRPRRAV